MVVALYVGRTVTLSRWPVLGTRSAPAVSLGIEIARNREPLVLSPTGSVCGDAFLVHVADFSMLTRCARRTCRVVEHAVLTRAAGANRGSVLLDRMLPRFRSGGGKLGTPFRHLLRGAFRRPRHLRGGALCEVERNAAQVGAIGGKPTDRTKQPILLDAHEFADVARSPHFLERLPRRVKRVATAVEPSPRDLIETLERVRLAFDKAPGKIDIANANIGVRRERDDGSHR
jgi:hypothetical protein